MNANEAARLAATALTSYQHTRTVAGLTAAERGATMDLWARVLCDLDYRAVDAALLRHIATSPFMPTPADLRATVSAAEHGRRRDGGDAFGDIGRLQQQCYSSHRPAPASAWSDQRARWVFERLGGWTAWAELEVGAPFASFRKQFVDLYNSTAQAEAVERSLENLPGVARIALPADARPIGSLLGDTVRRLTGGDS